MRQENSDSNSIAEGKTFIMPFFISEDIRKIIQEKAELVMNIHHLEEMNALTTCAQNNEKVEWGNLDTGEIGSESRTRPSWNSLA